MASVPANSLPLAAEAYGSLGTQLSREIDSNDKLRREISALEGKVTVLTEEIKAYEEHPWKTRGLYALAALACFVAAAVIGTGGVLALAAIPASHNLITLFLTIPVAVAGLAGYFAFKAFKSMENNSFDITRHNQSIHDLQRRVHESNAKILAFVDGLKLWEPQVMRQRQLLQSRIEASQMSGDGHEQIIAQGYRIELQCLDQNIQTVSAILKRLPSAATT